jgi:hypothetical protein
MSKVDAERISCPVLMPLLFSLMLLRDFLLVFLGNTVYFLQLIGVSGTFNLWFNISVEVITDLHILMVKGQPYVFPVHQVEVIEARTVKLQSVVKASVAVHLHGINGFLGVVGVLGEDHVTFRVILQFS